MTPSPSQTHKGITMELMLCESTLLDEIGMKEVTRNHLALTYALSLRSREAVDWAKVNKAIMDRWSRSGLHYIKDRAWKIVEGKIIP